MPQPAWHGSGEGAGRKRKKEERKKSLRLAPRPLSHQNVANIFRPPSQKITRKNPQGKKSGKKGGEEKKKKYLALNPLT